MLKYYNPLRPPLIIPNPSENLNNQEVGTAINLPSSSPIPFPKLIKSQIGQGINFQLGSNNSPQKN